MDDAKLTDYRRRIDRVQAHIARAVAEDGRGDARLDLDALAEIACFSRFHFHRIYRAMTGETPAQTVRRLRLHRAATALLDSDRPVAEIAKEAGYGGVEAFTRAFAAAYCAGPATFRAEPHLLTEKEMENVRIVDTPAYRLAAIEHRGSFSEIGTAFDRLSTWAASAGIFGPDTRFFGVYYDDPHTTPEAELRSAACVTLPDGAEPGGPTRLVELPAGPHAVYRHVGPYAELGRVWDELYRAWLPQSGRQPADAPPHEHYVSPPDVAPAELITDLYIPLQPA